MKNSQIKELIQTHFPTFSKLARLSYRQITFALVTLGIVLSMPGSATAWTWVLHHNGHSPTPTGPSINGGGRLIQRQNYNPGSNSQRWSFVENGNGRHMLMNLATKKCMNVYLAKPQSRPNDYLCNRDDKEQQFRVRKLKDVPHSQPAMDVMIQVADIYHNGKGLCLDDANGHFQLHYCNQNNTNMVFRMDRVSTYIASDIVNQGTQQSRNSGGGSNGNQGNTQSKRYTLNDFSFERRNSLIRTGGYIFGKSWKSHEFPFLKDGISAGWDQQAGNNYCRHKWDRMPFENSLLVNTTLEHFDSFTGSARVSGEIKTGAQAGNDVTVKTNLEARIASEIQSGRTNSNQYTNSVEFVLPYRVSLLKQPLTNVTWVWYHQGIGVCVADQHTP